MNASEKLKVLREQKGMSQADCAKAMNIDRTTYAKYENGGSIRRNVEKLASFFNVSVDYLLGRTDEPQGTGFQKGLLGDINGDSPGGWQNMSLDDDDDSLDTESQKLLADYRQLDEKARETIKSMIEISLRKKANSDD